MKQQLISVNVYPKKKKLYMSCCRMINYGVSYSIRFIHRKHEERQYFPFFWHKKQQRPKSSKPFVEFHSTQDPSEIMHLYSASQRLMVMIWLVAFLCAFTSGGEYPSPILLHSPRKKFNFKKSFIFLIRLKKNVFRHKSH